MKKMHPLKTRITSGFFAVQTPFFSLFKMKMKKRRFSFAEGFELA